MDFNLKTSLLLCAGSICLIGKAQSVDLTKYTDYEDFFNPDYALLNHSLAGKKNVPLGTYNLPDHVNNAETKYFPPVFNQAGGSCGSASRIGYMFTHEINAYRGVDGNLMTNRYPTHFVWLLTKGNSGKEDFAIKVGVPNAEVYGGYTYSQLFGNQNEGQNDFGWMQGYDKWYSAMWNRMIDAINIPVNVSSEEGRMALKRWLYNHNGDNDFHTGGIAGVGVAATGQWRPIPSTPTNDESGVTGKQYVYQWGTQVNHALTIVGYDDRIEFDLDGNGKIGEKEKDEVGAWIIVNSWGPNWCNKGFIYCPYAYGGKSFVDNNGTLSFRGNWWFPQLYKVRKDYRPLRTIKLKMNFSHRSELHLSAGISTNLNAETPDIVIPFEHFKYAGDGNNGNTNPAPEIPMLGRWADGKLHTEPMEFGYDLTDLSNNFDKDQSLKYFFIIDTKSSAIGTGKIHSASIIDYEKDMEGMETPFILGNEGVTILNKGQRTIISTIVRKEQFMAPRNFIITGNQLTWNTPDFSSHPLEGYSLSCNGTILNNHISKEANSFTLENNEENATYRLSALYENGEISKPVSVRTPITIPAVNQALDLNHSGFSIPNVFNKIWNEATIEFWINPHSLADHNQTIGPGWGKFLFQADKNGAITTGWSNGGNHMTTSAGKLKVDTWSHIALTVKGNVMTLYVNGIKSGSVKSSNFKGIGGFGSLDFGSTNPDTNIDALIDEIKIWNYAKESREVLTSRKIEFSGNMLPSDLVAYYKGNTHTCAEKQYLHDYTGNFDAEILNAESKQCDAPEMTYVKPHKEKMLLNIQAPKDSIFCGISTVFNAEYSHAINELEWEIEGADITQSNATSISPIFKKSGEYKIIAKGRDLEGQEITDNCMVQVHETPNPDASFNISTLSPSVDERVNLIVAHPMKGYAYLWEIEGSKNPTSNHFHTVAQFTKSGDFKITLTATSADGKKSVKSQTVKVADIAPEAQFDINPGVVIKGETVFLKDRSLHNPTSWQWYLHSEKKDVIINGQNTSWTPMEPGIYDVTLSASNSADKHSLTRHRGIVVCNADSKSGLNITQNNAQVTLQHSPFAEGDKEATLEWWMNPNTLADKSNAIGEVGKFYLYTRKDGKLTLAYGKKEISTNAGFVAINEWHHYAVTFDNGNIKFYRDGILHSEANAGIATLPTLESFAIGHTQAPFKGQLDEFRIWNTALTLDELHEYINAPIADVAAATQNHGLCVYYDCNQNGGDVIDRTEHHNNGVRSNFGPDGDAWGLSSGVFCLNLTDNSEYENVSDSYLKNYKSEFGRDGDKLVNSYQSPRFGAIADWTLKNITVKGKLMTCVHVDKKMSNGFTFAAGYDGFSTLKNHKAYQTVTLPAGTYTFTAHYSPSSGHPGKCGRSYLTVAKGNELPDNNLIQTSALAYKTMSPKDSKNCMANSIDFVLLEETEVSLGLVIDLSGHNRCVIDNFELQRRVAETIDADNNKGYDLQVDGTKYQTLYLPYATKLPNAVKAYAVTAIKEDKVVLEEIKDILPANVGVIINAEPGNYHFQPTTATTTVKSILVGANEATDADSDKRYFAFDAQDVPGFYLYNGATLEANQAYLVTDMSDTHESYTIDTTTGIEDLVAPTQKGSVYDISGRQVHTPNKGIYITNNKKVYVK